MLASSSIIWGIAITIEGNRDRIVNHHGARQREFCRVLSTRGGPEKRVLPWVERHPGAFAAIELYPLLAWPIRIAN